MLNIGESNPSSVEASLRRWCSFIRDRRWSRPLKHRLLARFETLDALYAAPEQSIRESLAGQRWNREAKLKQADIDADLVWLSREDHHLIHIKDARYPAALMEIPDPPLALFAIGDVALLSAPQLAIVGSRRPTPVGSLIANDIAAYMARAGINVTSGMALGIDGIAHAGALAAGGTSTAVLGSGLDLVTPVRNKGLFGNLCSHGLVVSEYPLGTPASRYTFPERNRIVSGLSLGVVIVEAAHKSGTLITARLAAEQNREVMVVPGSAVSRQYQGSHVLIQQGAALVTHGDDVLHCLAIELSGFLASQTVKHCKKSPRDYTRARQSEDAVILRYIGAESTSIDHIILASGLTAAEVSSMLITLEIEGVVAVASDGGYINLS